jgi:periplasmic protein TonB
MFRRLIPDVNKKPAEPRPAAGVPAPVTTLQTTAGVLAVAAGGFPVFGDAHPLRVHYRRTLARGMATACALHMIAFTAVFVAQRRQAVELPPRIVVIDPNHFAPPAPIAPRATPPDLTAVIAKAPPPVGVPEPVSDFLARNETIAGIDDLTRTFDPVDLAGLTGSGPESLVVAEQTNISENPLPDAFVPFEEPPSLVQMPPPVYPEIARLAEVEGTVVLRVLVGKDGKVADAIVTSGIPMLNDAALAAARAATFRPALQQRRPVAVWVQIPMEFALR